MATLVLKAYDAKRSATGYLQVLFDLTGKPDTFPRREVAIKSTADALAALEAYKAEAAATGKPMVVTMGIKDGDRKPNGFKAAAEPHYHPVNV